MRIFTFARRYKRTMGYLNSLYAFLLFAQIHVGVVSSRPYPYRPIGVKRSEPGEVPFEVNGIDAEPQFSPPHVDAFHRRTIGARNQGLPARPNPYMNGGVYGPPPWGLPPPSGAERAENQLRNSDAAKNPKRNLWVYNNAEDATALYVASIVLLFFVAFPASLVGIFWLLATLSGNGPTFGSDTIVLGTDTIFLWFPLSLGMLCVTFFATMDAADKLYNCLVANWRLGMEQSKKAQIMKADERRWSGEINDCGTMTADD